jgi:hypothetical protein
MSASAIFAIPDFSEKNLTIQIGEIPVKGTLQWIVYDKQVMTSDAEWEDPHRIAQGLLRKFRQEHPLLILESIIKTEQWPSEMVRTLERVLSARDLFAPIYVGWMIAEFPISEEMVQRLMWILENSPDVLFHSPEKELYK